MRIPTMEGLKAQKLAHKAHTAFKGTRLDKYGYLVTKCLPCKTEHMTWRHCDSCNDDIKVTAPNQTHCPACGVEHDIPGTIG